MRRKKSCNIYHNKFNLSLVVSFILDSSLVHLWTVGSGDGRRSGLGGDIWEVVKV